MTRRGWTSRPDPQTFGGLLYATVFVIGVLVGKVFL